MEYQRVRNLTTGILHTSVDDVYKDIEYITGTPGVLTSQLGLAVELLSDWLKFHIEDQRFFDGKFDKTHIGELPLEPMNELEKLDFFSRLKLAK